MTTPHDLCQSCLDEKAYWSRQHFMKWVAHFKALTGQELIGKPNGPKRWLVRSILIDTDGSAYARNLPNDAIEYYGHKYYMTALGVRILIAEPGK